MAVRCTKRVSGNFLSASRKSLVGNVRTHAHALFELEYVERLSCIRGASPFGLYGLCKFLPPL